MRVATSTPTRRGDHRSLIFAFFVVLPAQFALVGGRYFDLFTVFIPVYVFLAIPVLSALAGDPQRFLERNAKIQWGIMVCVFGLSHAPALLLLALGLALAVASLVALSGLSASVRGALNADARRLHGADILVRSSAPLGAPLIAAISRLEGSGAVAAVAVHEFNALVRRADETASLLCNLKVVDPGYPFYGAVTLASGRSFGAVLSPGSVVVERDLLERLRLNTGDPLHIGSALLTIDDVVAAIREGFAKLRSDAEMRPLADAAGR